MEMLSGCSKEDKFIRAFEHHTTGCGYYSGCEYRPLCKYYENPLVFDVEPPRGFRIEKWEPFSVADITKNAVDGADE